ncbi:lipoprotein [Serratia sp. M24T3]|uniref:LPS-assembly lipoprotein LptM n=1 Tax=Rouxiella sp. WC2420 TaxID=3234145 RepID=A0AB39VX46_9GAMM|nr:lipoprotein [Serratia sp. M24T3]
MKTALRCSMAAMALFALSGCGLKGPLYFPPAAKSANQKAVAPNANQATGVSPDKDAAKNSGQLY